MSLEKKEKKQSIKKIIYDIISSYFYLLIFIIYYFKIEYDVYDIIYININDIFYII